MTKGKGTERDNYIVTKQPGVTVAVIGKDVVVAGYEFEAYLGVAVRKFTKSTPNVIIVAVKEIAKQEYALGLKVVDKHTQAGEISVGNPGGHGNTGATEVSAFAQVKVGQQQDTAGRPVDGALGV